MNMNFTFRRPNKEYTENMLHFLFNSVATQEAYQQQSHVLQDKGEV